MCVVVRGEDRDGRHSALLLKCSCAPKLLSGTVVRRPGAQGVLHDRHEDDDVGRCGQRVRRHEGTTRLHH